MKWGTVRKLPSKQLMLRRDERTPLRHAPIFLLFLTYDQSHGFPGFFSSCSAASGQALNSCSLETLYFRQVTEMLDKPVLNGRWQPALADRQSNMTRLMPDWWMVHPRQTLVDLDMPEREDRKTIAGAQKGADGCEAIRFEMDVLVESPIRRHIVKDSPAGKISCRVHPTELGDVVRASLDQPAERDPDLMEETFGSPVEDAPRCSGGPHRLSAGHLRQDGRRPRHDGDGDQARPRAGPRLWRSGAGLFRRHREDAARCGGKGGCGVQGVDLRSCRALQARVSWTLRGGLETVTRASGPLDARGPAVWWLS